MLSFVPCRLRTEHFILQGSLVWFCFGFLILRVRVCICMGKSLRGFGMGGKGGSLLHAREGLGVELVLLATGQIDLRFGSSAGRSRGFKREADIILGVFFCGRGKMRESFCGFFFYRLVAEDGGKGERDSMRLAAVGFGPVHGLGGLRES